ncbi:hypothetical protein F4803DRAFT_545112 [Xylaria telfairii]|nr:hypothetical protein F4803DRAFT_545112 [Xylaria telfairii]
MALIMFRLIDMQFEASSVSEVIRLGLLCFCCSVFLQWRPLGISYSHLISSGKMTFTRLNGIVPATPPMSYKLTLWLLMADPVLILHDSDKGWLQLLLLQAASSLELQS